MRKSVNKVEIKPLSGRGIVITRPLEQTEEFASLLRAQGARLINFPTIKVVPTDDWRKLDEAIDNIGAYQWIIFTSVNGVACFFKRLRQKETDIRDLKGIRICAIGPATAGAIEDRGIITDLVPDSFISEGVVEAFRKEKIKGSRVLLPRAETARDVIPRELSELGAKVDVIPIYHTVSSGRKKAELDKWLRQGKVDVITFTSPSTVINFMEIMGQDISLPAQVKIACIGPVTAAAVKKAGLKVDIMQDRYTIPGLVEGLVIYFNSLIAGTKGNFSCRRK
jgi:uroporphyrinogen III methyltransferase / synthase